MNYTTNSVHVFYDDETKNIIQEETSKDIIFYIKNFNFEVRFFSISQINNELINGCMNEMSLFSTTLFEFQSILGIKNKSSFVTPMDDEFNDSNSSQCKKYLKAFIQFYNLENKRNDGISILINFDGSLNDEFIDSKLDLSIQSSIYDFNKKIFTNFKTTEVNKDVFNVNFKEKSCSKNIKKRKSNSSKNDNNEFNYDYNSNLLVFSNKENLNDYDTYLDNNTSSNINMNDNNKQRTLNRQINIKYNSRELKFDETISNDYNDLTNFEDYSNLQKSLIVRLRFTVKANMKKLIQTQNNIQTLSIPIKENSNLNDKNDKKVKLPSATQLPNGIMNYGNTCYFNCFFQLFVNIPCFRKLLYENFPFKYDKKSKKLKSVSNSKLNPNYSSKSKSKSINLHSYSNFYESNSKTLLSNEIDDSNNDDDEKKSNIICINDESDISNNSNEDYSIFHCIKMMLYYFTNNKIIEYPVSLFNLLPDHKEQQDVTEITMNLMNFFYDNLKNNRKYNVNDKIFEIIVERDIFNKNTKENIFHTENHVFLSLDIEFNSNYKRAKNQSNDDYLELEESLDHYFDVEYIKSDGNADMIIKKKISKLPKILFIQLNRLSFENGESRKINKKVVYYDELNLKKYVQPDIDVKCFDYSLFYIIVHEGHFDDGHYYSYIKQRNKTKNSNFDINAFDYNWVKLNDANVSIAGKLEVFDSNYGDVNSTISIVKNKFEKIDVTEINNLKKDNYLSHLTTNYDDETISFKITKTYNKRNAYVLVYVANDYLDNIFIPREKAIKEVNENLDISKLERDFFKFTEERKDDNNLENNDLDNNTVKKVDNQFNYKENNKSINEIKNQKNIIDINDNYDDINYFDINNDDNCCDIEKQIYESNNKPFDLEVDLNLKIEKAIADINLLDAKKESIKALKNNNKEKPKEVIKKKNKINEKRINIIVNKNTDLSLCSDQEKKRKYNNCIITNHNVDYSNDSREKTKPKLSKNKLKKKNESVQLNNYKNLKIEDYLEKKNESVQSNNYNDLKIEDYLGKKIEKTNDESELINTENKKVKYKCKTKEKRLENDKIIMSMLEEDLNKLENTEKSIFEKEIYIMTMTDKNESLDKELDYTDFYINKEINIDLNDNKNDSKLISKSKSNESTKNMNIDMYMFDRNLDITNKTEFTIPKYPLSLQNKIHLFKGKNSGLKQYVFILIHKLTKLGLILSCDESHYDLKNYLDNGRNDKTGLLILDITNDRFYDIDKSDIKTRVENDIMSANYSYSSVFHQPKYCPIKNLKIDLVFFHYVDIINNTERIVYSVMLDLNRDKLANDISCEFELFKSKLKSSIDNFHCYVKSKINLFNKKEYFEDLYFVEEKQVNIINSHDLSSINTVKMSKETFEVQVKIKNQIDSYFLNTLKTKKILNKETFKKLHPYIVNVILKLNS